MPRGFGNIILGVFCCVVGFVLIQDGFSTLTSQTELERYEFVRLYSEISKDFKLLTSCIAQVVSSNEEMKIELMMEIYDLDRTRASVIVKYYQLKGVNIPRIDELIASSLNQPSLTPSPSLADEIRLMLPSPPKFPELGRP